MRNPTRWISVVMFIIMLIPSVATAQELPAGNDRNTAFIQHWVATTQANPQISDFQSMRVGTEYNLPTGGVDTLQAGDVYGIWGREFRKWFNVDYNPANLPALYAMMQGAGTAPASMVSDSTIPWWIWLTLALLSVVAALFANAVLVERERRVVDQIDANELRDTLRRERDSAEEERSGHYREIRSLLDSQAILHELLELGWNERAATARAADSLNMQWQWMTERLVSIAVNRDSRESSTPSPSLVHLNVHGSHNTVTTTVEVQEVDHLHNRVVDLASPSQNHVGAQSDEIRRH
jgi:hypothetical protein